MPFLDELAKETNKTETENGALTNLSTLDPLLDFFSRAGAMRANTDEAVGLFGRAFSENKELSLKALFYLRDVRGGQGERSVFRACLAWLLNNDMDSALKVLPLVAEYGRWDDLVLTLDITPYGAEILKAQLDNDLATMAAGEGVSLLAKWLPSENTSSRATQKRAATLATLWGMKPKQYRMVVVSLRKYIKLLEQKMSASQWAEVDYEKLPGQALRKHTKAFRRHDEPRFDAYLAEVEAGTKKIKTSTLFTYEVYELLGEDPAAANAMWANLPDYTQGGNALVVADVSGSMSGRPMATSVSLALYFAERNKGAFNGYFMTFSATPRLVKVQGANLQQRMGFIESAEWGMNTDLHAAFRAILAAATAAGAAAEDVPTVLYIISDMEFDACVANDKTNLEQAKADFEAAGFKLPHVVFWNVNARNMQSPATKFDNAVTLISGSSAATFKYAVEGKTPMQSMLDILASERYAKVTLEN